MDVLLITDGGVKDHPVDDLAELLRRDDGLVWVDIPDGGIQLPSPGDQRCPRAQPDAEAARLCRSRVRGVACAEARSARTRALHRAGPVHRSALPGDCARADQPGVDPAVALRQTSAVLARIKAGRLMSATGFELSYAVVSALTRDQEDFIEAVTKDVWRLEKQVTGGALGNPEGFVKELFQD